MRHLMACGMQIRSALKKPTILLWSIGLIFIWPIFLSAAPINHHQLSTTHQLVTKKTSLHNPQKSKKASSKTQLVIHARHQRKPSHQLHMSRSQLAKQIKKIKPHSYPALSINSNNVNQSSLPFYFLSSREQQVVDYVRNTVRAIHYSTYKLGGQHFDTEKGVYMVDCSSYVDKILKRIYPNAFYTLADSSGTPVPTSHSYYQYFKKLPEEGSPHWDAIQDVSDLRPGDVLVFRYKNKRGHETGGHVMLVMDKPIVHSGNYLVRVADSAAGGHTLDTRFPQNSGIGIGTLVLRSRPQTDEPYAYAWRVGYRLKQNVKIAMARPVEEYIED